jgi:DNA-binding GntR family transcriptional regulator
VPVTEAPFIRSNLREQIKDVILQRILDGEYPSGARIVETRIAQELGVSQAPVREALRDLEQLGCIVHEPFRGCSVRAFSADELLEAFPVRAALERLAIELAAPQITDAELERLAGQIRAMRPAGDAHDQSAADVAFHETIVVATRNATLVDLWRRLQPHARTFISLSMPASQHGSLADRHEPILAALRRRDAAAAAAAMAAHLADAADRLRAIGEEPRA